MAYLLGVDTGGTYTDAVVYDDTRGEVIGVAKAATTHDDLAEGIGHALDSAMADAGIEPELIDLVSLSTTLATNALVEDKGRRACLLLIGFEEGAADRGGLRSALSDDELITATGGHSSHGDEAAELDVEAIGSAIDQVVDSVDAFAVAAQFSVRNPAHELAVRDLIRQRCDLPVTCSHELSSSLNGPKRGLTALLNARLIAMVDDLVVAAEAMLAARDVTAPVMIVRGNGSLVSTDFVRDRPIETILSGPAASLIGAHELTGATHAVVADMGGTTTDIAILRDGQPRVTPEGASVGGHWTMVEAVEIYTHGLGGDSEVAVAEHAVGPQLVVGPRRVIPIARAAQLFPDIVRAMLTRQLASRVPGEFDGQLVWQAADTSRRTGLGPSEEQLLEKTTTEAMAVDDLIDSRVSVRSLGRLINKGLVRASGFTPTDAAHVLGHQTGLDREAAELAAQLFARRRDRYGRPIASSSTEMSTVVLGALVRDSARAILAASLRRDGLSEEPAAAALVDAAFDRTASSSRVDIGVQIPIIGLGAPAPTYFPMVADLLGSEAVVPPEAAVANAIGAAVGRVQMTAEVVVSAPRRGVYRIHHKSEPETVYDLDEARHLADAAARTDALAAAEFAGARDVRVGTAWEERSAHIEDKPYFVEGTARATAVGRPALR